MSRIKHLKRRLFAAAVIAVMLVTGLSCISFASGSSQKPTGLEFQGNDLVYAKQFVQSDLDNYGESWAFEDMYAEGNKIIVHYSDHDEAFVPAQYRLPNESDEDGWTLGFFPEGEEPHFSQYEDGDWYADNSVYINYNIDLNGTVTIKYSYMVTKKDEEGNEYIEEESITGTVKAKEYAEPQSVSYSGPALTYEPWDEEKYVNLFQEGGKITVKYKDGTSRTAVCRKYGTSKGDGDPSDEYDYFWEGEEPVVKTEESGYIHAENGLNWSGGLSIEADSSTKATITYREYFYNSSFEATGTVSISKKVYPYPKSVKFVPAKGFKASVLIGQSWFYDDLLGGTGNKFVVTYSDGTTKEFVSKKYKEGKYSYYQFVYHAGKKDAEFLYADYNLKSGFKKGATKVVGKTEIWSSEYNKYYKLSFTAPVKTSGYYSYAEYETYTYTGKAITPKVTVYVANDKGKMVKMSSSKYSYTAKKNKKIGVYHFNIKLKNKADQKKYGKSIVCYYSICPKAPTGVKVTAGSKKLTVKWDKQSDASSYEVLVSRSKKFDVLEAYETVKKNKTSCTIKGLEKGKKYYVYVVAVKNKAYSDPSKIVSKKTK